MYLYENVEHSAPLAPNGFHQTIEQKYHAKHRFNPPACPNANTDVESVHATIETELFDAQVFHSRSDFFAKLSTYQLWYNAARKNSSRAYKSPADLLAIKAPHLSPKIFLLHPIPLESLLPHQGGHDVPRLPGSHAAGTGFCPDNPIRRG